MSINVWWELGPCCVFSFVSNLWPFQITNLVFELFLWIEKFTKYFVISIIIFLRIQISPKSRYNNKQWHIEVLLLLKVSDLKLNFLFLLLSSSCLVLALILILHLPAKKEWFCINLRSSSHFKLQDSVLA